MTVAEWFAVGVGAAGALWWWRFNLRWMTYDKAEKLDPFHLISDYVQEDRPQVAGGVVFGTFLFVTSPIWMPFYLGFVVKQNVSLARQRRTVSRAFSSAYLRAIGGPK